MKLYKSRSFIPFLWGVLFGVLVLFRFFQASWVPVSVQNWSVLPMELLGKIIEFLTGWYCVPGLCDIGEDGGMMAWLTIIFIGFGTLLIYGGLFVVLERVWSALKKKFYDCRG